MAERECLDRATLVQPWLVAVRNNARWSRRIQMQHVAALLEQLRGSSIHAIFNRPRPQLDPQQLWELLLAGADHEVFRCFESSLAEPKRLLNEIEKQLLPAIITLDTMFLNQQLHTHQMWLAVSTAKIVLERLSAQLTPSADPIIA